MTPLTIALNFKNFWNSGGIFRMVFGFYSSFINKSENQDEDVLQERFSKCLRHLINV